VSCGKQVSGFTTALGRLDVMCQNPSTGVVLLGHSGGTFTRDYFFDLQATVHECTVNINIQRPH